MNIKNNRGHNLYKHGLSRTKEWNLYHNIKRRCYCKTYKRYNVWGGRGIKMYDEWINDLVAFVEYVKLLPNYNTEGYSLDRIDNDGNYEPGNLRWTDNKTQRNNQRKCTRNTSGYEGIYQYKDRKKSWRSRVNDIIIGFFYTIKEAIDARNNYIIENNLKNKLQEWK